MTPDKYEVLGPALNSVGRKIADIIGTDPNGAFLYAEVGDCWVSPNLYKDESDRVRFYPSLDHGMADLLLDIWETESSSPDERWVGMEYEVKDDRFSVRFIYRGEIDPDEDGEDRRERILRARYGDKPILYPSLTDDETWELKSER